jgi:hypothetical protein
MMIKTSPAVTSGCFFGCKTRLGIYAELKPAYCIKHLALFPVKILFSGIALLNRFAV